MEEHSSIARITENRIWMIPSTLPTEAIWPPPGVPCFVHFGGPGAMIRTGLSMGTVGVRVQIVDRSPAIEKGWEDIVEGDLVAPYGGLRLVCGDDFDTAGPAESPDLLDLRYRVRVSAVGRAANISVVSQDDPPTENDLIQAWRTESSRPAVVHRSRS